MVPALQVMLDLAGIFVFAITGALVGVRKQLDVFGVQVLALVTGLGGGFIRDVLIGALPPAALEDWRYLVVPVVAGLVTFFLHPGLGYGLGPLPSTLLGTITGIGGGVLRDGLSGRVPVVLRSEIYATPAFLGAALVVTAHELDVYRSWVAVLAAVLCFAIRFLAIRRGWNAPRARHT